jgi:hypothetical protein
MVHPATAPPEMPIWTWIYQNQVAAAMTISRIDDGWEGSRRRELLLSLLNGPMDWTVDAAAIALAMLAREDPEIEREITPLLVALVRHGVKMPTHVCYLAPATKCILQLPNTDKATRREMEKVLKTLSY